MLGVFVVVLDDKLGHVTSLWQNYGMFHLIGKVCILEATAKVQNTVFVNTTTTSLQQQHLYFLS